MHREKKTERCIEGEKVLLNRPTAVESLNSTWMQLKLISFCCNRSTADARRDATNDNFPTQFSLFLYPVLWVQGYYSMCFNVCHACFQRKIYHQYYKVCFVCTPTLPSPSLGKQPHIIRLPTPNLTVDLFWRFVSCSSMVFQTHQSWLCWFSINVIKELLNVNENIKPMWHYFA